VTNCIYRIAALLCLLALAGPHAAAAPGTHPAVISAERAAPASVRYWTRARMTAARNLTGTVAGHRSGAAPASTTSRGDPWVAGAKWPDADEVTKTTGRVFFVLDGTDYSCSGSTVASANADVVVTAAHCVSDGEGKWATHWIFVPGYNDGRSPYGRYTARAYFAAAAWQRGADEADDVAFVAVNPAKSGRREVRVVDAVGGQQIEFGYRGAVETVFGYPSDPPYNGRYLEYCEGPLSTDPYGAADVGTACALTEGISGGPWFSDFNPLTGLGVITGVSAFKYADAKGMLYSAELGSVAKALYEQAQHA